MPVVYQRLITRSDLRSNPHVLYIFGDNEHRKGLGGQAQEMRGEPNAVGIRTKEKPSQYKDSFWSDDNYDANVAMIDEDMQRVHDYLANNGVCVYPMAGIGTGLSEMPDRCPRTFAYISTMGLAGARANGR